MLEDLIGNYGTRFLIAALGVGLALVCFAFVMMYIRRRAPSPFVRGGKNRQPRLQVLDAAAVDARRRLVLVRRDDVEHLIMIGGPTDIVIESGIGELQEATPIQPQFTSYAPEPPLEPNLESRPEIRPAVARVAAERQVRAPESPRAAPPEPAAERRTYVEPGAMPEPIARPHPAPAPAQPVPAQAVTSAPARHAASAPEQVAAPPTMPIQVSPPRVAVAAPATEDAAEALEAARQRVLPQQVARPVTPAAAPVPPRKELGSEFDRILEAEMASNLSAERITTSGETAGQPNPKAPPRQPGQPVITGGGPSEDPVQKEMARIFGEMSVTREK
ncbi:flagellar biosynthetic protein FliO [Rhizobiaceae bacterium n13]|uniref:Flagellar biosynthetic protein FliO n=1 Tax=Ferirhizobium litorale TaxID=2927786 RepID=A0AAE3U2M2_9HYPH|nr:flagellar biosynthetic protein FliO [Fererhizobium litorale]MDI7863904.1 flagellar biosynthetic protein FliO [Fererhizobium litorale]MDI7924264.1 flagellar biosynthetic protein FliO [Fererhizobium litorale]